MDYILLSAIYYGIIGELESAQAVRVYFSNFGREGLTIRVVYDEPELLKEFEISRALDEYALKSLVLNNRTVGAVNPARDECYRIGRELGIKLQQGLDVAVQQQREERLRGVQ